jgi:hypothetical protein
MGTGTIKTTSNPPPTTTEPLPPIPTAPKRV